MRWLVGFCLIACGSWGCVRGAVSLAPDGGAVAPAQVTQIDAGHQVTAEKVDAWLAWQAKAAALGPVPKSDGGSTREALAMRARLEAALRADAGLSAAEVDVLEEVIAAVVAERAVERMTGAAAMQQFKGALAELSVEQRVKAEAALAEANGRASSWPALEARYGKEVVRVVLARENDVTRVWDALLESR